MEPIDVTYDICRCYIKDHVHAVDPALVAKVDGFRRSRNLAGLTACSQHFDQALHSIGEWRFLRQVEAFFKKNALLANKEKCADAAQQSFEAAEQQCRDTNLRLKTYVGRIPLLEEGRRREVTRMASYISRVLGDFRSFRDALPHLVKVTPGATSHASRRESLPQLKLGMRLYASRPAHQYLRALYAYFGFREPRLKPTHANRVELVPKNWKTDRTIACEPEGNLPLQLAFDTYAKRRLRRFGIDLRDQSANKERAKHASVHDDFVTVDFSAASDTISYNAVSLVFPVDWFDFLRRVRTAGYRGVFGTGVYSKFSSMGNGSTFCIETLMFAAACHAVGAKNFLVYGDDVIIEKECYEAFVNLTRFLGFTINAEKSFATGPFRESCGGDYYNGVDVTPIYIRNVDKRKASLCHLVNTMLSLAYPNSALSSYLLNIVKEAKLPLVPVSESTLAGVWIDPTRASELGILRTSGYRKGHLCPMRRGYLYSYKAYTAKYRRRNFVDSRGYYLWFLNKNSQVLFSSPWAVASERSNGNHHSETSWVPVYEHKYVRKRVCWHTLPAEGMPDHLYWWSELVCPRA